jgi:hypothetical protein
VAKLECDALALMVVRLGKGPPSDGDLSWHLWHEAEGAEPHGIGDGVSSRSRWAAPFKGYPRKDNGTHYFNKHVENVLYPPAGASNSNRWVCCPDELYLDIVYASGTRSARIELLERLSTPVAPHRAFGLIHLSLCPSDEEDAEGTLSWASALRSTYLKATAPFEMLLRHGDRETTLDDPHPIRQLAGDLFGDPGEDLDTHLYTVLMAGYPKQSEFDDAELQRKWRSALATRSYELNEERGDLIDPDREKAQSLRIAGGTALVLRTCTVLTRPGPIDGVAVSNFRSYWSESLVFGLLQELSIEDFQSKLAALGPAPHMGNGEALENLHRVWLSFRNQLWWPRLSTAEPPQELLALLRKAQGTDRLFEELGGDVVTYSDLRHREIEDRQVKALANLQVYGSAIAVLSTLGTFYALLDAHGVFLAILLVAAAALSFSVLQLVRAKVARA